MKRLKTIGAFWYDFVVGDDWRVAVGVVAVLGITDLLTRHGADVWWLVPLVVLAALAASVLRVAVRSRDGTG